LSAHQKKWEEGVLAIDIWIWENFSTEQSNIVRQIWTLVARAAGKKYQLDELFNANHQDMKAKLEINDKVVTCLNAYCQQASDKDAYEALMQKLHERFERENVRSVQVASALQTIVPFAEALNAYATAVTWRTFLNKQMKIKGKFERNLILVMYTFAIKKTSVSTTIDERNLFLLLFLFAIGMKERGEERQQQQMDDEMWTLDGPSAAGRPDIFFQYIPSCLIIYRSNS
jgi:hypothetical protein